MKALVFVFVILLSGCAAMPANQDDLSTRAAVLTAQFNAAHGTAYPVPAIGWMSGSCENQGDTQSDSAGWMQYGSLKYFVNSIRFTRDCMRTMPAFVPAVLLPHELCHILTDRLYGRKMGHDRPWQECALELGTPADDAYITEPDLRVTTTEE